MVSVVLKSWNMRKECRYKAFKNILPVICKLERGIACDVQ